MDWNDLPVLLAVSRSSSLAQAGELLAVNPTTVSRRLEALQAETGSRLVERSPEGFRLTEAGELAVSMAEHMEGIALELERKLLGGDAKLSGALRVTTTDTLAHYESELFSSFASRYPDVELEISTSYSQTSLSRRQADVAVRWSNGPDPNLFGRKMLRADFALFAHPELICKVGKKTPLERYPWLAWNRGNGARLSEKWMKQHVPNAHILCRFDSALAMYSAISNGAGIAFMPCAFGRMEKLSRLRKSDPSLGYDIWCLTHPDLAATARVRAFMSHAAGYFAREAQKFGR